MRELIPVIVAAAALLVAAGLAIWVWLPSSWRRLTLPALPLIGAGALTVGLHLTGILVGVRTGLVVLAVVAVLGMALRSWRQRWWDDLRDLGALLGLGAALLIGGIAFWILLMPARGVGLDLVAPGGGSDSFAYISPAAWLEDHPLTDVPTNSDPPVWGYTQLQLNQGFRMGEELDQAAVSAVSGHDVVDTWYTTACIWVLILPGGLIAAASALGLSRAVGAWAGVLAAGSAVVLEEVIYSHSAGALGLAIAPLALAMAARYLDDAVARRPDRPPAWLAAGGLTALGCTYTEYLPAVALAAVLYVMVRRWRELGRSLLAAGTVAVVALVTGPLAWWRVALSFHNEAALIKANSQPAAYLGVPVQVVVSHYVGTLGTLWPGSGSPLSYIPLALIVAGVLLAAAMSPARRFFAIAIGSIAAVVGYLSTVSYFPYGQGELVAVTFPMVMLAVAAGYAALLTRLRAPSLDRLLRPAAAAMAVLTAVFAVVDVHTVLPYLAPVPDPYPASAIYDTNGLDAVHSWLLSVAGPTGSNAMVLDTQVWDEVWLMYSLRGMTDLNFPYVEYPYSNAGPTTQRFDGHSRRYAVVERDLLTDVNPADVVGGTTGFAFLDLSRGTAIISVGAGLSFNPVSDDPGIGTVQWMANDGQLLIFHSSSVSDITLTLRAVPQLSPNTVQIRDGNQLLATSTVTANPVEVPIELPPGDAVLLTLDGSRAAAVVPPDTRLRSIGLVGVQLTT